MEVQCGCNGRASTKGLLKMSARTLTEQRKSFRKRIGGPAYKGKGENVLPAQCPPGLFLWNGAAITKAKGGFAKNTDQVHYDHPKGEIKKKRRTMGSQRNRGLLERSTAEGWKGHSFSEISAECLRALTKESRLGSTERRPLHPVLHGNSDKNYLRKKEVAGREVNYSTEMPRKWGV